MPFVQRFLQPATNRYLFEFGAYIRVKTNPFAVGMRGDKSEALIADFELVQNDKWADEKRRFYIPYWPQPGLIPRNKDRGSEIVNISFKGFSINLDPYFMEKHWINWLTDQGMVWAPHVMEFFDSEESGVLVNWHDYSDIDIVLAICTQRYYKYDSTNS